MNPKTQPAKKRKKTKTKQKQKPYEEHDYKKLVPNKNSYDK